MALSFQRVPDGEDVWGRMRVRFVDVALDTSYPNTGGTIGYLINASDLGFKMIYSVDLAGQNLASLAWTFFFDMSAAMGSAAAAGVPAQLFNMKLFVITTGVQVANGTDVHTGVVRLQVTGR